MKKQSIIKHPLTMDTLVHYEDEPSSEAVPEDIKINLANSRIMVTIPNEEFMSSQLPYSNPKSLNNTIILPKDSFIGMRVQETTQHELGSLDTSIKDLKPHRPQWEKSSYSPRISNVERFSIRRLNGRVVIPTDSGRVYGEYPSRVPFYPNSYPWKCIGRLFVWKDANAASWSSYGSAVLVGNRAILSAGHMVPWDSGTNWKALFVAGYYDGNSTAGPGGQSWISSAHGWNPGGNVAAHDMAVLRLNDPLGSWLGYVGIKAYDDGWEGGNYWNLVGYPSMVTSERPSWQGNIAVLDDDEDGNAQELEHHGDDTGGDSGGPFFGFWDDGPYAIGTVSGYEVISGVLGIGDEDNNIVAGGPALNAIVKYARDNWP